MDIRDRTHWIFDMDGTLTVPAHDFDAIRSKLGLRPKVPILEQLAELPDDRAFDLRKELQEIELKIAIHAKPQAGAYPLLKAMTAAGKRLGILTRNSHANALKTLVTCGLNRFFQPQFVLGREACDPKPSPEGVRKLLLHWGAAPDDTVVVGDYLFDLMAGRQAGAATVYLDTTGKKRFARHADLCVESLGELLSHVFP